MTGVNLCRLLRHAETMTFDLLTFDDYIVSRRAETLYTELQRNWTARTAIMAI